jgi:hypothetical protein
MQITEGAIQRVGECHCGALKVIAAGEPERVYLCHCKACQRRTGTAFHFGVTYQRARVRLDGEYKIYERAADRGSGSISVRPAAATCGGRASATRRWAGWPAAHNFDLSPTSAIFEESMHRWLELPSVTEHHRQGRSSAASWRRCDEHGPGPSRWDRARQGRRELRASVADGFSATHF